MANNAAAGRLRNGIRSVDAIMADDTLYIRLWGEPIAQPRPRARLAAHGRIIVYDPSTRYQAAGRILLQAALDEIGLENRRPVYPGGRSIKVVARFHTSDMRKDIDNLAKFLLDVLQGPVIANDRFVVQFNATKIDQPNQEQLRTDIEVEFV